MGEAADDILNGITCQVCGAYMDDMFTDVLLDEEPELTELWDNPPGYPRTCPDCEEDK